LPICFPAVTDTYEGDISRASGWGTLVSGGSLPNILQEVDMEVLTDALCDSRFSGTSGINDMLDPSRQVCAGHIGENKDTCQGDSGGPLAVQHADGYWYLIGLTSWVSIFVDEDI
jgi:secreted trypsin-like serine protease